MEVEDGQDVEEEQHLESVKKAIEQYEGVGFVEVFSPPRATDMAQLVGLRPGLAMDLTTGWNFDEEAHRRAAEDYVRKVKPLLLIGSPECCMFSALQNLNKDKFRVKSDMIQKAKEHIGT